MKPLLIILGTIYQARAAILDVIGCLVGFLAFAAALGLFLTLIP